MGPQICTQGGAPIARVKSIGLRNKINDARLIEAAPDLLRELQHAFEWLEDLGASPDHPQMIRFRQVLANATGEST